MPEMAFRKQRKINMEITFAGGAMEVGGSCIHVSIGGHRLLLDSGIRQGSDRDPMPDFLTVQQAGGVEAILISHAHMDHTGSLPVISRAYPEAPIYMNQMTLDLTRVLLQDSLRIMGQQEDGIPHYTQEDVEAMFSRVRMLRLLAPQEILPGIRVTQYLAGHIAGAVCFQIESEEGVLFYSGDISGFAQQTVEAAQIPKLRPDVAIFESTYGNRLHSNRQAEENRLVSAVAERIAMKGKVLIPAFALGRSQEVLLILRRAMQNGDIPKVPVIVDGMVRDICRVYKLNPTYLKAGLARRILKGNEVFYNEEIRALERMENREDLLRKPGPVILVSSSGMLSGGPSVQYAKLMAGMENASILLTGYQDEESPGRALLNLLQTEPENRRLVLDGLSLPVRCHVDQVGLSAHADKSEIVSMIDRLAPRHVVLVHGDQEAIGELSEEVATEWRRRVYCPLVGEKVEILLGRKRQQIRQQQPATLCACGMPGAEDLMRLREFWLEREKGRPLTPEMALFLWCGDLKRAEAPDEADRFARVLTESGCFLRDSRHMHLLRPATEEELEEDGNKLSVTPQEVEEWVRSHLQGVEIRKISIHLERSEAVVTVDYPATVNQERMAELSGELRKELGWTLSLNPSANFRAMEGLVVRLFGGRFVKPSYYTSRCCYEITRTSVQDGDEERRREFKLLTGWNMVFRGEDAVPIEGSVSGKKEVFDGFRPPEGTEMVEQNLAMSILSWALVGEAAPLKKSIREDKEGRYIELMYLTPEKGKRFPEEIQEAARQTGWRIKISETVNQGKVMALAEQMLAEKGLIPKKNPSFLGAVREVRVLLDEEIPEDIQAAFAHETGFTLKRAR